MTPDELPGRELYRVEIVQLFTDGGDVVDYCDATAADGGGVPLGVALGMLRLAEDTLIRRAMDKHR